MTKISRSLGILTREMIDALNVEPWAHVFKKKSLITMSIVMELDGGTCYWPTTCGVGEDDEAEEAAEEGAGGSSDVYRNMSTGDWQACQGLWMDQMDNRWGQMEGWMTVQDQRTNWMYDHTVCQFQHLSTRNNLESPLQIEPFPGREADYPPLWLYWTHACGLCLPI
ncbi:hypothetical protein Tco_1003325 [Tanacetum coccineum]|uniref:Uncharacterized protein n=1 Tax=Tanacetum coccineum TaxID=301880 RepID=A0ABQ5F943_9ASTR